MEERRGAERLLLPEGIDATISNVTVRLLELSRIGARVEHEERIPLNAPQLRISWRGATAILGVKIARAEIAGRRGTSLIYRSGVSFTQVPPDGELVIAAILGWADDVPVPPVVPEAVPAAAPSFDAIDLEPDEVAPVPPQPKAVTAAAPAPEQRERLSLEDSWTRSVRFFKDDLEEEHLPYAQFRLTELGWKKTYVASPEQPPDGFTIARGDLDFAELQKTFECADSETRRMMQIALESKLAAAKS